MTVVVLLSMMTSFSIIQNSWSRLENVHKNSPTFVLFPLLNLDIIYFSSLGGHILKRGRLSSSRSWETPEASVEIVRIQSIIGASIPVANIFSGSVHNSRPSLLLFILYYYSSSSFLLDLMRNVLLYNLFGC